MPNTNVCQICCSAETFQADVSIVNSDVHFLHDKGHFIVKQKANGQSENLNALTLIRSPKLLTKREARCYYCQHTIYLDTIGAPPNNVI